MIWIWFKCILQSFIRWKLSAQCNSTERRQGFQRRSLVEGDEVMGVSPLEGLIQFLQDWVSSYEI
jgi:hypothetical protein